MPHHAPIGIDIRERCADGWSRQTHHVSHDLHPDPQTDASEQCTQPPRLAYPLLHALTSVSVPLIERATKRSPRKKNKDEMEKKRTFRSAVASPSINVLFHSCFTKWACGHPTSALLSCRPIFDLHAMFISLQGNSSLHTAAGFTPGSLCIPGKSWTITQGG